ncbi:transglutaminase-like cysteine peptidase [Dechloromonas sp. XY25]|uniref:Transglutaminase-like cysteine peptidase n=1 Tax=Dechloromonas hankyongensis TaxID=2908002 RepID=A0ABS9K0I5_9RHOO|nr:transglutaminase-like cysteine peptidase [Dechloromonas hankyongensis]MCG2576653.1 transglutaminase-like cysteine peptidase [Dechloromonas hankyongensis]
MPNRPLVFRQLIAAAVIVSLWLNGLPAALGWDFERLQQLLTSRFGQNQVSLLREWQQLVGSGKGMSDNDKLKRVNDFFNQHIAFDDDMSIWGQSDYWATPIEVIGQGRGDCEDYSIAKYYSLLELGIPVNKLRLVYVKAVQSNQGTTLQVAHMVLAYYPTPTADPIILDNLNGNLVPASKRNDLLPIFSFNGAGLWMGTGNTSSKSNLSRWQDLLARARAEGFQ